MAGAWFGNDDDWPMHDVTGGSLPARLFGRVLTRGLEGIPPRPLPTGAPRLVQDAEPPPATVAAAPVELPGEPAQPGFLERLFDSLTSGGGSVRYDRTDADRSGR